MILGNKDKEMHITMVDLLARFAHMVSVAVLRDIKVYKRVSNWLLFF
jgi:hypothetical protein